MEKKQIENHNLDFIKSQEKKFSTLDYNDNDETFVQKGTNPLLWYAPTYSVRGKIIDNYTENPNAYLKRKAEEKENKS